MNSIKSVLTAVIANLVLVSVVNAAPTLSGASAPDGATQVSGIIAKYINFTKVDNSINLGDMGGPAFGLASTQPGGAAIRYFESAAPTADLGKGQKISTSQGNTAANRVKGTGNSLDSAEVIWDANTHVKLAITYGHQMSQPGNAPHDADGHVLKTWFRTQVKGRDVRMDGDLVAFSATNSTPVYVNMGETPAPDVTEAPPLPDYTYDFSHGLSNGIKLDVQVQRLGVRDHWGTYQTGPTTLTWVDLN